jgi:hypothetical protein
VIAGEQRDSAAAEAWFKKSLAIEEKQGNEHGAAITYHQLGRIAEEQRDYAAADAWYRTSLLVYVRFNNPHNTGIVLGSFARLLAAAAPDERDRIRANWQQAGLGEYVKQAEQRLGER